MKEKLIPMKSRIVNREEQLKKITDGSFQWDVLVIGGGATGLGIAVDAASGGCKTVLL